MKGLSDKDIPSEEIIWLRGRIIEETIKLERDIERVIVHYFAEDNPSKAKMIHESFITGKPFTVKLGYFRKVINEYRKKYKDIRVNKTNFYTPLREIIEQRDRMAHARWTMIWPDGIHLKDKTGNYTLTNEEQDKFVENWGIVFGKLNIILNMIGYFDQLKK